MTRSNKHTDDSAFIAWVQRQKSCVSGRTDFHEGEEVCEAAHVRRGGKSGTSYKEAYAAVPLTRTEHHIQTVQGEHRLMVELGHKMSVEAAKSFFDFQLEKYRRMWKELGNEIEV